MSTHQHSFAILGAKIATPGWTGTPITLAWHDSASMPQTPNGSTVMAWQNTGTQNNDGTLGLSSGGTQPQFLDAPANSNQPSVLVQNWKANNLNLTNLSANANTPIWIEMFGPGLPGPTPTALTVGSPPISLGAGATAQGKPQPNWMQLVLQSNTANLTIVALVGGPVDPTTNTNAYVFALNYSGTALPPGYTAVTGGNTYTYQFNWGSSSLFVANMSPQTAAPVQVSMISL